MNCPACGTDNPEDVQFCGGCCATLSASPVSGSTPQDMDTGGQEDTSSVGIPDDALIVRQSNWAYMLHTIPWLILFGASLSVDFFTFGILPALLATYLIGSRYMSFRKTVYILTDRHVIIKQGSMMSQDRIDLPFDDLDGVFVRPGRLGVFLRYTRVELQLKDGQMVLLTYVPLESPLLEHPPLAAVRKKTE